MTSKFGLTTFLLATACGNAPEPLQTFGLDSVAIELATEDQSMLNTTIWSKTPVPANAWINDRKMPVWLNYAGATTIDRFKRSYHLKFRNGQSVDGHRELRVGAQAPDPFHIRSIIGFEVFRQLGFAVPSITPAVVYVNDEFQGLFILMEPINAQFFGNRGTAASVVYKAHYNDNDIDKLMPNLAKAFSVKVGPKHYGDLGRMLEAVMRIDEVDGEARIERHLDVDEYLRFIVANYVLNNFDGFQNNMHWYREPGSEQMRPLPWDLDSILKDGIDVPPIGEGKLAQRVAGHPMFQLRFREQAKYVRAHVDLDAVEAAVSAYIEKTADACHADRTVQGFCANRLAEAKRLIRIISERLGRLE